MQTAWDHSEDSLNKLFPPRIKKKRSVVVCLLFMFVLLFQTLKWKRPRRIYEPSESSWAQTSPQGNIMHS